MSLPEKILWRRLKDQALGFVVRRQHPVDGYYLDFFVHEAMLCIEVDGSLHDLRAERDIARDEALAKLGILTIRISARAIFERVDEVVEHIYRVLKSRTGRDPLNWEV
jgi:very-short-patch-repair endonuclease